MEAIIEKLLLIEDEQILNTPLEELDLPTRVYRSLRRGRVWTIRDLAQIWSDILPLRNIGTWARGEILGALEAWSISIPNFTDLAEAEKRRDVPGCHPDLGTSIEALHLSQRTYRALKRNKIHTIADLLQGWDKIPSIRNVGQGTMDEIHKALEAFHPSHECPPTKNDFADPAPADAVGYEPMSEVLTKTHVISDSGVLVSVDLLQSGEPRRSREERWRNVAPKPQDYAPKNTFQAIGEGQNKISSPIERRKKTLDGSVPIATEWLEMSLYLLERTRTSRQVRTINCPICMALTLSIKLKQHLVENHPQAYQEVRKVAKGSSGRQFQKHLVDRYTQAFQELKKAPSDSPGRHTEKKRWYCTYRSTAGTFHGEMPLM